MDGLKKGQNGSEHINIFIPTFGTPVNAVASKGTLTVDTQPIVGDTFTIGTKVFTFVTDGTAALDGEVDVGADLADAKVQIVAAINGTDGWNDASEFVIAAAFATNDCVLTAIVKGEIGDSIATTETFDATTNVFDDATLGTTVAGINGTKGKGGEQLFDSSYLYLCVSENDTFGTNWRRISVGSAY